MYFSAIRIPFGVLVEVELFALRPFEAAGLFEAGDRRVDEVGHHVRDERPTARAVHRRAVERGPYGLAQVDVREHAVRVVEADVVATRTGRDLELALVVFG